MEWFVGLTTGIISGSITGMLTCWFFYWLSGKDLNREADHLRRLNVIIIRALDQAGLAEVSYDQQGNPTGLIYKFHGNAQIRLGGSAIVEVRKPDAQN